MQSKNVTKLWPVIACIITWAAASSFRPSFTAAGNPDGKVFLDTVPGKTKADIDKEKREIEEQRIKEGALQKEKEKSAAQKPTDKQNDPSGSRTLPVTNPASKPPAGGPRFITDSLEQYIEKGMRDWQVPGLAIAIVKDGKVVFSKGYGVRELGREDKVDENTLFIIASNSKLFTGTAIAKLDYEKKLSLNDRVTKYIPWFRLYDSTSTRLATVRDMLTHRIGTKTFQGDFTFWDSRLPKDSIIWKMRYLEPHGEFRQDYGYCNAGFVVAGQILEKVTGQSWESYVQHHILTPLGMTNTYMNTAGLASRANVAQPHNNLFTSITKIPFDNVDNMGPATSMVSNVKDLSRWIMLQLDSGRFRGSRILPWQVVQQTRDVNIITSSRKSSVYPSHFRGYGLGVYTTDYNGRQVYWHTGGAFGHVTNVCFVPEENLGITILTNNDNQGFFEALRYQVLDAYLGVPYTDRSAYSLKFFMQNKKETERTIAALQTRVNKKEKPGMPVEAYTGDYFNKVYGRVSISRNGDMLICRFEHHPDLIGYMDYMDNHEFRMTYSHIGYGIYPAKFKVTDGKAMAVEIKANDFVENDAYLFEKITF